MRTVNSALKITLLNCSIVNIISHITKLVYKVNITLLLQTVVLYAKALYLPVIFGRNKQTKKMKFPSVIYAGKLCTTDSSYAKPFSFSHKIGKSRNRIMIGQSDN